MDFHYPRYRELPDELVFIDDVVDLVNSVHADLPSSVLNGRKCFTRSMASNYTKQGLTPPAVGKKYAREHICLLLFAATIKLVGNAESTVALSKLVFSSGDYEHVQDALSETFDRNMRAAGEKAKGGFSDVGGHRGERDGGILLGELLSEAVAAKTAAHLLSGI